MNDFGMYVNPSKRWTTKDMKSFASWAIHSGKCRSNPTYKDILEWSKEKPEKK